MRLGYTLLYVPNVVATVEFYEKAFGMKRHFIHESNGYAEMDTGATKLGFVSLDIAGSHGFQFQTITCQALPSGFELGLVTADVQVAYDLAVKAGAQSVSEPIVCKVR